MDNDFIACAFVGVFLSDALFMGGVYLNESSKRGLQMSDYWYSSHYETPQKACPYPCCACVVGR